MDRNAFQPVVGKANTGPQVFLESRNATAGPANATSTQLALVLLRLLLRHLSVFRSSASMPRLLLVVLAGNLRDQLDRLRRLQCHVQDIAQGDPVSGDVLLLVEEH